MRVIDFIKRKVMFFCERYIFVYKFGFQRIIPKTGNLF
jgi:hypothetical protein